MNHSIANAFSLQLILGSIFLAPIRFVVAFLGLCFCSALARFFLYVLTFIDREKEPEKFHWWRNIFKRIVMLFFRSSVFFCGFYDLRITQKGAVCVIIMSHRFNASICRWSNERSRCSHHRASSPHIHVRYFLWLVFRWLCFRGQSWHCYHAAFWE